MKEAGADFTPLTGPVKRRKFLVFDIESKDGKGQKKGFTRPFMVGLYDGRNYDPLFDTTAEDKKSGRGWSSRYWQPGGCVDRAMRKILTKRYRGHYIYAHNGGRFDFLFILPWLMNVGEKLGFRFSVVPVSSSIQALDIWRGTNKKRGKNDRWRFLDSYKLIPIGLDRAAKSFGEGGKVKFDLDLPETDPGWVPYNKGDCVKLFNVLTKFHDYVENVLCGEVGMTAPATAVKLLRRRYMTRSYPRNTWTHDFIREGYVGGRVEPFIKQGHHLSYFDLNSSYPFAMLSMMPAGNATEWKGPPPKRFMKKFIGFCKVDVHVPTTLQIPSLPIRGQSRYGLPDGKLVFPTGRLTGTWEWTELQLALELGCTIEKWHSSVWYEPAPLFEEYIHDLYRYRDKSRPDFDEGLSETAKNLMNSCYGKFGMRTLRKKIYRWDDPELPAHAKPACPDHEGLPEALIWYAEEEVDAAYIMPQISARVTALGRVRLYRAMQEAMKRTLVSCDSCERRWTLLDGKYDATVTQRWRPPSGRSSFEGACSCGGHLSQRPGRVYYCDTDSVITDVFLPTGNELGALKDEYPKESGALVGTFVGPKVYLLEGPGGFAKVKAKGIQLEFPKEDEGQEAREAAVSRNWDTVMKLKAGGTIMMNRLEKVGALAQAEFLRGPKMMKVPRTLRPEGAKRLEHADGTTTPYQVSMW